MSTVQVNENPNSTPRWLLPVALALLVAIIIAIGFFATHPHIFASSATDTPTLTPTPRTKVVTATPTPRTKVVTATPTAAGSTSGAKATPTPTPNGSSSNGGPTPTPQAKPKASPTLTPTPSLAAKLGIKIGVITHTQAQLSTIQQGANRNEPQYTLTLDPYRAVRSSLPSYGFKTVHIVNAPAAATPTATPFSGPNSFPTIDIPITYLGHRFTVQVQQPVQKGPKGIWVVTAITPA